MRRDTIAVKVVAIGSGICMPVVYGSDFMGYVFPIDQYGAFPLGVTNGKRIPVKIVN